MEKEELIPKFTEALGSTQLQLTEQTMDGFYEEVLAEVGDDDAKVNDAFIERKINFLKKINGQLHADVSTQVEAYKKSTSKVDPTKPIDPPKPKKGESEDVAALRKEIETMKSAQKTKETENAKNAIKDSVKSSFEANQKKANLAVNPYFLKQTLRDLKLPEDISTVDVDKLAKQLETEYNKALKEADFEGKGTPRFKKEAGGVKGKTAVEDYFAKKKIKEHWDKKG